MLKISARTLLVLYIVVLIWLVLFKFSVHIFRIFDHHHRSLNLIPFAAPSMVNGRINVSEMVYNCVFFIPFGLLLSVNFKKPGFIARLTVILVFSVAAEITQYIFAIGATDITDVITNTAGGFIGLALYVFSSRFITREKLDILIVSFGFLLLLSFLSIYAFHFIHRLQR